MRVNSNRVNSNRSAVRGPARGRALLLAMSLVVMAIICLGAHAPSASADAIIASAGTGAGQTRGAVGLAVDWQSGHLYVADVHNQRIDVFDAEGKFLYAFGWGVADGQTKALQTCSLVCYAGLSGAGPGQFARPTEVAVDNDPASPSWHDVYVVDSENVRVEKFGPKGEFLLSFGEQGEGEGQFTSGGFMHLAVGPQGTVYITDARETHSEPIAFADEVDLFDADGTFQSSFPIASVHKLSKGIVAAPSGDLYVLIEQEGILEFTAAGEPITAMAPTDFQVAIAGDAAGDLFVLELAGSQTLANIVEYDPAGSPLRRFGYGELDDEFLATFTPFASSNGDVYVGEGWTQETYRAIGGRIYDIEFPPPGPVVVPEACSATALGSVRATLNADVNPEGSATTAYFEYVDQANFEAGGFASPATVSTPEAAAGGDDFDLHAVSVEAVGLKPETTYHCRVDTTNANGKSLGLEGTFTTRPPMELRSWIVAVGTGDATLAAEVEPIGVPAAVRLEYIDDASYRRSGFSGADSVPVEPLELGGGESWVRRDLHISGLAPGTSYDYRVVGKNAVTPEVDGTVMRFRTYSLGDDELPDERAYELVSPPNKENADDAVPGGAGGLVSQTPKPEMASASGDAITFTSAIAFGENTASAPGASQYVSRRTSTGWSTVNVTPPYYGSYLRDPVRAFSGNLSQVAAVQDNPPLVAGAPEGVQNLYTRDTSGGWHLITATAPHVASREYCVNVLGASEDFDHVIFSADGALTSRAPVVKEGNNLYEWTPEAGVRLVSVLPGGAAAPPRASSGFGDGANKCEVMSHIAQNAISADGSRIFWTTGGGELMARVAGTQTVQLDATQGGTGRRGGGRYWGASEDGADVFFTDANKLTPGATAQGGSPDLYRYDFDAAEGSRLTDITAPDPTEMENPAAEVQGVVGMSADGSYVYFVARGDLTGEEETPEGEQAIVGNYNLYVWHEGSGARFIASLNAIGDAAQRAAGEPPSLTADLTDWGSEPRERTASVSRDGQTLAFASVEPLTGFDNRDQLTGAPDHEVFIYNAATNTLHCASCNPAGARPIGSSALPAWTVPYQQPRSVSADGSRVFFTTDDTLSPQDSNSRQDVYEYETSGSGSCTSSAPSFSPADEGCVSLISSGAFPAPSYLIDASSDGDDVFISTAQSLVSEDTDEHFDVYDARIGGGFAEPVGEAHPCEGEACRPPLSQQPVQPAPATTYPASGNVKRGAHEKTVRDERKHRRRVTRLSRCRHTKRCRRRHTRRHRCKSRKICTARRKRATAVAPHEKDRGHHR